MMLLIWGCEDNDQADTRKTALLTRNPDGSSALGEGVAQSVCLSPDGMRVCYLMEHREVNPFTARITSRVRVLHWGSTSDPTVMSSVQIETLGAEYGGYVQVDAEVRWSPNSSRIGVRTPHRLVIVEANSGKHAELKDGTITSFAWLSDSEVAYGARRIGRRTQERVVCRLNVDTQQKTDVLIFPKQDATIHEGVEEWSPSGRFVIIEEPYGLVQLYCVTVFDGTKLPFGQAGLDRGRVAWSPDSSRVFCVLHKAPIGTYEAVLLDPETGTTLDCSGPFQQVFANQSPELAPVWTVDGQYVLVNTLSTNGYLVRPQPWEAIPLGQRVAPAVRGRRGSSLNPRLFSLPVAGWVGVLPTGNEGDSPVKYACDYAAQRTLPLLSGYPYDVSQNGTMAAAIGDDGHIKIHRLGKWWLGPNSTQPSRPARNPGQAE